jgi:cell division initiation protein
MSLNPAQIREVDLRRRFLGGYRRDAVNQLLTDIADSFEAVWRERGDLAERVHALDTEADKHRELEGLLRSTLVSAERASQEMKAQARRESDLIVQEAHAEGRRTRFEANAEKQRLEEAARTVRALLQTALESLDGRPAEGEGEAEAQTAEPSTLTEAVEVGIRRVVS